MDKMQQISWWLRTTLITPWLAIACAVLAHYWLGWTWPQVQITVLAVFASVCVIWWFWIMATVRHIIQTYDRVELSLARVSDQLVDIKQELGSIQEHNY